MKRAMLLAMLFLRKRRMLAHICCEPRYAYMGICVLLICVI
jgi:hypothetical protein